MERLKGQPLPAALVPGECPGCSGLLASWDHQAGLMAAGSELGSLLEVPPMPLQDLWCPGSMGTVQGTPP